MFKECFLEQINVFYKFLYNKVDYSLFKELFTSAYTKGIRYLEGYETKTTLSEDYLKQKWKEFNEGDLCGFVIKYPEFAYQVLNEIERSNYNG